LYRGGKQSSKYDESDLSEQDHHEDPDVLHTAHTHAHDESSD